MSPLRRAFYDIFRVCEASRALPHNETTILSEPTWHRFQQAHQGSRDRWNPLEEITTLMLDASAFNLRCVYRKSYYSQVVLTHTFADSSRNTISRISEEERATNPSVLCLAVDGQRLQRAICDWHDHALAHLSQAHHHPTTKPNINLALLKYHALLLFLSGGPDDSFPNWINLPSPALTQSETCDHVTLILDLSEQVLRHGSAPGVLLFFPLTIAGCRAIREDQRGRVLSILDRVRCSGFGTAKRVSETILQCWARRDAEGRGCRELAVG
ncbi:fungal-specific transcription factor domain-containing protein [Aspergillus insuetus]